ncbi:hypothetical protein Syun_015957 [Stephania yunnanensis]|uniref:Uncharacterized protein n=1 Tax=Stephania yunnanensis TaxID=152371 RepID=A0AAP0J509_9MAGN
MMTANPQKEELNMRKAANDHVQVEQLPRAWRSPREIDDIYPYSRVQAIRADLTTLTKRFDDFATEIRQTLAQMVNQNLDGQHLRRDNDVIDNPWLSDILRCSRFLGNG